MSNKEFHISQHEIRASDLASIRGFAPDLQQCLINLGLRQDLLRTMDLEFTVNMGMLCTSISMLLTNHMVPSDWRFSQFGLLYVVNQNDAFEVIGKGGVQVKFNHAEFSLVIGVLACRDNILVGIVRGIKNQFRMSYFYLNFLLFCVQSISVSHIDVEKVGQFLQEHRREDFIAHEPYFDKYLNIPVT